MKLSVLATPAGVVGALCAAAAICLGDVTEDDVRRLTGAVAPSFNEIAPGKMYAVPSDIDGPVASVDGSPVCWYRAYESAAAAPRVDTQLYTNRLGQILPVAAVVYDLIGLEERTSAELELTRWRVALKGGIEPELDTDCETPAQRAFARGDVVCVVESVERLGAADGQLFAVKFKKWAFTPAGATEFPTCPLGEGGASLVWPIKQALIVTSVNATRGFELAPEDPAPERAVADLGA